MDVSKKDLVDELLDNMKGELESLSLWSENSLTDLQLSSTAPFGCDVMDFHEWLQHIFYTKMKAIINSSLDLPTKMAIAPMAKYVYKEQLYKHRKLIGILLKLDRVINDDIQ